MSFVQIDPCIFEASLVGRFNGSPLSAKPGMALVVDVEYEDTALLGSVAWRWPSISPTNPTPVIFEKHLCGVTLSDSSLRFTTTHLASHVSHRFVADTGDALNTNGVDPNHRPWLPSGATHEAPPPQGGGSVRCAELAALSARMCGANAKLRPDGKYCKCVS